MEKHRFCPSIWLLRGKCLIVLLTAFLVVGGVFAVNAQDDENFESSDPVLISEADSTKGLTANPDNWRGSLPEKSSEYFTPGARVVVFVTNIDFPKDENANAFRAFAEDTNGRHYR